jgi:hypothetical protein
MRLTKMRGRTRMPPLRTAREIAEMLGISTQQLAWALKDDDAPQPALRAGDAGHLVTGNNKVWYEPKAVVSWYRSRTVNENAEKRREYHRKYYRLVRSAAAKKASDE